MFTIIEALIYVVLGMITICGSMYFIYWMIIEMPVLLRIKHESLYNKWRNR